MVFCSLGKIANVHSLGLFIFVSLSPLVMKAYATDNIQFNTDVLDVRDRKNIDLSQFSRSGYIMPRTYDMVVHINKNTLPEQEIPFYEPDDDPNGSRACINPKLVEQLGLKPGVLKDLAWWHKGDARQEKCEGNGNTRRSSNDLSLPEYTAGIFGIHRRELGPSVTVG